MENILFILTELKAPWFLEWNGYEARQTSKEETKMPRSMTVHAKSVVLLSYIGSITSRCSGKKPALLPRRPDSSKWRKSSLAHTLCFPHSLIIHAVVTHTKRLILVKQFKILLYGNEEGMTKEGICGIELNCENCVGFVDHPFRVTYRTIEVTVHSAC